MLKKLKIDVFINLGFSFIKVLALMLVIRLAGIAYTPYFLGLFLLSRRISSTGANLLQLGMSQTILRYVAMNTQKSQKYRYPLMAVLSWIALIILIVPIVYYFSEDLSIVFFKEINQGDLTFWTSIVALLTILHFISYSTLLAEQKILSANVVELLNTSGIILLIFYINDSVTPVTIFQYQSLGMLISSIVVFSWYFSKYKKGFFYLFSDTRITLNTFIKYGLPRGMITFLDMSLLLIAPWLIRSMPEQVGYLIIAMTFVRIIQTIIGPISQIASVKTALLLKDNNNEKLMRKGVNILVGVILYTSIFTVVILYPWLESILNIWLKDDQLVEGVMFYSKYLMIGIIPLSFFQGLKGIIEVRWTTPYNLYSLFLGIIIHFLSYYSFLKFFDEKTAIGFSILLTFLLLGLISIYFLRDFIIKNYFGVFRLLVISTGIFYINSKLVNLGNLILMFIIDILVIGIVFILYIKKPLPFTSDILGLFQKDIK